MRRETWDLCHAKIDLSHPQKLNMEPISEWEALLVTRWLTESSAYQPWQSIMVSHRAVDQFNSWDSSINMSPPDLLNWSTALWDTIIDCQDLYAELKINHLVTRRTWPTEIRSMPVDFLVRVWPHVWCLKHVFIFIWFAWEAIPHKAAWCTPIQAAHTRILMLCNQRCYQCRRQWQGTVMPVFGPPRVAGASGGMHGMVTFKIDILQGNQICLTSLYLLVCSYSDKCPVTAYQNAMLLQHHTHKA